MLKQKSSGFGRRQLVGAAMSAVIAAAVLAGCGSGGGDDAGDGDPRPVVASADGAIELTIPDGALPEGVTRSDISIIAIAVEAPAAADVDSDNGGLGSPPDVSRPIAGFDLQPSGLRFREPITATLRIPRSEMAGPLVIYHLSEDGIAPLDIELASDLDPEVIEATVQLESFSSVIAVTMWISQQDLFTVTQAVDRTMVPVNLTFNASATVTRLSEDRIVSGKLWVPMGTDDEGDAIGEIVGVNYRLEHTEFVWFLRGTVKVMEPAPSLHRSRVVTPPMVRDPERMRREEDVYRTATTVRTCEQVGPWDVYYQAFATSSYSATPTNTEIGLPTITAGPHSKNINVFREQGSIPGQCTGDSSGENGSQTQPDRPPVVGPIVATVSLPVTTYNVDATDPDGDALTFAWSGNTCGKLSGETTAAMSWPHGDDVCPHTTAEHGDATIVVTVTAGVWQVTCRYPGAAAGTGKACGQAVNTP